MGERRWSAISILFAIFVLVPSAFCTDLEVDDIAEESAPAVKPAPAVGPKAAAPSLAKRLDQIEESLGKIEAEMEILKAQNRMVIQRTTVGFLNQVYLKGGASLLVPRARTFASRVDTGLGAFAGVGKYFGRHHVFELTLDYDIYPAASIKYRFEFHLSSPLVTLGPTIGFKQKVLNLKPFDNFLEDPSAVKKSFAEVGLLVGFPMSRSMVAMELLYLFNKQAILVGNVGIHFFL